MTGEKFANVRLEQVVTAVYSLVLYTGLVIAAFLLLRVNVVEFLFTSVLLFVIDGALRGAFWPTDDDGLRKQVKTATLLVPKVRPEPASTTQRKAFLFSVLGAVFLAAVLFGLSRAFGINGFALGLLAGSIATESLVDLREAAWVAKWQKQTGRVLVRKRGFRLSRKEPTYFYLQPFSYDLQPLGEGRGDLKQALDSR